jgi:N-methylhydantoinase B
MPEHLTKEQDLPVTAGDRVRVETPGGGGYGPAFERDPALVARDVALGYFSADEADRLFGVILTAEGEVDTAATRARRQVANG